MDTIGSLRESIDRLLLIKNSAEKRLKELPEGRLIVEKHYNGQFFVKTGDVKKYIKVKNRNYAEKLAQAEYERKVFRQCSKQLTAMNRFLKTYDSAFLKKVYLSIHPLKREFVKVYEMTDEDYVKKWLAFKYETNRHEMEKSYTTAKGDKVRSKSEALIADRLYSLGIPYRYECPLELGKITLYPDFTLLDVKTREEIIYEHFGMMDDSNYVNRNFIYKTRKYGEYNIKYIFSCESYECPLDMRVIERMFKDLTPYKT